MEVVCRVWGGYQEDMEWCLMGVGRVYGVCAEDGWIRVGCLEDMGRLSGGCGEDV